MTGRRISGILRLMIIITLGVAAGAALQQGENATLSLVLVVALLLSFFLPSDF